MSLTQLKKNKKQKALHQQWGYKAFHTNYCMSATHEALVSPRIFVHIIPRAPLWVIFYPLSLALAFRPVYQISLSVAKDKKVHTQNGRVERWMLPLPAVLWPFTVLHAELSQKLRMRLDGCVPDDCCCIAIHRSVLRGIDLLLAKDRPSCFHYADRQQCECLPGKACVHIKHTSHTPAVTYGHKMSRQVHAFHTYK